MPKLLRAALLLLVLPLLGQPGLAGATATPDLPGYCALAASPNVWQGAGVDSTKSDDWEDGSNWTLGAPVVGTDDLCIPSGGTPHVKGGAAGEEAHVHTLDIDSGAVLTVEKGAKLFLYGRQGSNDDSVVRAGGQLNVFGGTLGGIAKLHVIGTLVLRSLSGAASTLTVRDCAFDDTPGPPYQYEEACTSPNPTPVSGPTGLIEVADTGTLDVQGGGVNLGDQYRLLVRGLMRVRSGAYVAADHGTRLELRPHLTAASGTGTLRFEGDGGYLEGFSRGITALSAVVDQGLITKTGGTGQTLVTGVYNQPSPGAVTVKTGSLLLPSGPVTPATVGPGVTYGTGRCTTPNSPSCATTTKNEPGFQQNAQLQVPSTDPSGARVVVRELTTPSSAGDLGKPYEVHATGLSATASHPGVITMRFDASVLGGKLAGGVRIYHQTTTSSPYVLVKACTGTGAPPTGETTCVDRRNIAGVSSRNVSNGDGSYDAIMVIRTTVTSRWVGR